MSDGRYPLVSIVIPCWNAEHLVGEAISSALAQDYPNIEVIVVDDGSTDGSLDVIRSFEGRIRFESQTNCGGSVARNRGLAMARGQLIQFLDADDLLFPDKISTQVPLLGRDVDIVTCDHLRVYRDTGRTAAFAFQDPGERVLEWLLKNEGLRTAAPLHRRTTLERVGGFDESLPGSQEYDLHLRLFMAGARFVHISKPLWTCREQVGSVSSNALRVTAQQLKIFARLQAIAEAVAEKREQQETKRLLSESCIRNARRCYQLGEPALGTQFVRFAESLHPNRGTGFYRYNRLLQLLAKVFPIPLMERLVSLRRGRSYYR